MKYFGEKTKQDLIDLIYETEVEIVYKDAAYTFWLDGRGYNIGMTGFTDKDITEEEQNKTIDFAETVEELLEKYVLYDGARLADVLEMDVEDYRTMT